MRGFPNSLLSKWFRDTPNDSVSPVGETSRSRCSRSAGACPPRLLECADDGEGNPLACTCGIRGPKPYGKGMAFFTVARGPVPRDLHRHKVPS